MQSSRSAPPKILFIYVVRQLDNVNLGHYIEFVKPKSIVSTLSVHSEWTGLESRTNHQTCLAMFWR
jgi:hypothetical protein